MNEKSIWELLEIEPTYDKQKIRKAYAQQAKIYHLEEAPQAFAELNRAYQQALQYAKAIEGSGAGQAEKSGNLDKEIEIEQPEKEVFFHPEIKQPENSLLEKLAQAEQKAIEQSRKKGALGRLIGLLEDEKNAKKAEVWRDYFLSEDFLNEQFDDKFGRGLVQFLEEKYFNLQDTGLQDIGLQEIELNEIELQNIKIQSLPRPFVIELAVAYGLHPDSFGEVNVEGSFYNRVIAGNLWKICSNFWEFPRENIGNEELNPKDFRVQDSPELMEKLMRSRISGSGRILMRAENLVRLRSFSDYLTLRSMNQMGFLTDKEKEVWERIVDSGKINHLYEKNGRKAVYPETRSTTLLLLYAYWINTDDVPDCIYRYMYREYDLKNLDHSSRKATYLPLKTAILRRRPNIEYELFDKDSIEQMIRKWYQELMQIVSDYHSCYDRREYGETEEIRSRIEALFQHREWEKICYEPGLFDKMMLQIAPRKVLPKTLVRKLSAFYQEDYPWPRPDDVYRMQEGLVISAAFHRNLLEMDYRYPWKYKKTELSDIDRNNHDFWEYFLMTGFGCRSFTSVTSWQNTKSYVQNNVWTLPAYMQAVYMPSMGWRKAFVGFDEEENAILSPKSLEFLLPDGRRFRAEFHLHYIVYFIDEEPVIYPAFTFEEWKAMAETCLENARENDSEICPENHLTKEQCFILLAAATIRDEEEKEAEAIILSWLRLLPLAPATFPVLAKMLAADNAWPPVPENDVRRIQAVFYEEQERFCFKAEVGMRSIKTCRKTHFGWEDLPLLPGEGKAAKALDLEGKKKYAVQKLCSLRQPKPVLLASYSLEGMENKEKMRRIIDALKEQEQYRKAAKKTLPYVPGWPWSPQDITPAVRQFFAQDGGWMTESYVLLQMGSRKNPCFTRIFYTKMNIFGFDLSFQSMEFTGDLNVRTRALSQKIREKHLVVGHFGWGKSYEARKSFAPLPFAVGESGLFYAYDFLRLYKAESLEDLMDKLFDFSEVSRVDSYEGRLSVSRFDHELEYCYTEEDFQNYLDSKTKTLPDVFTKFGI
ncbi:MAG: J domain-containing protein [Lachnospiraceae bacterium]|nr:J domain-containing protein [Lachnospiraceae bacterium]